MLLLNGQIVSIAGDGNDYAGYTGNGRLATGALLNCPSGVVVSSSNQVYISDSNNNRIRKIDQNGIIGTIAGNEEDGYNGDNQLAIHAQLNYPHGLLQMTKKYTFVIMEISE